MALPSYCEDAKSHKGGCEKCSLYRHGKDCRGYPIAKKGDIYVPISDALKQAREDAGYTQSSASEASNIPSRTLQNWEEGIRVPPYYVFSLLIDWYAAHKK